MSEISNSPVQSESKHPSVDTARDPGIVPPEGRQEFVDRLRRGQGRNAIRSPETQRFVKCALDSVGHDLGVQAPRPWLDLDRPPVTTGADTDNTPVVEPQPLQSAEGRHPGNTEPTPPQSEPATQTLTDLAGPGSGNTPAVEPQPLQSAEGRHPGNTEPTPPQSEPATQTLPDLAGPGSGNTPAVEPQPLQSAEGRHPGNTDPTPPQSEPATQTLPDLTGPGSGNTPAVEREPQPAALGNGFDNGRTAVQPPVQFDNSTPATAPLHRGLGSMPRTTLQTEHEGTVEPIGLPSAGITNEMAQSPTIETPRIASSPAARLADHLPQVFERILASLPKQGTGEAVHIQLAPTLLEGSAIRILRDGGELQIVFLAKTDAVLQFLSEHRAYIQSTLAERMRSNKISVEVTKPGSRQSTSEEQDRPTP